MIQGSHASIAGHEQGALDQYHRGLATRARTVALQAGALDQTDALVLGEYLDAVDGLLLPKDEGLYAASVEYLGGFLLTCPTDIRPRVEAKSWAARTLGDLLESVDVRDLVEACADCVLREAS